MIKVKVLSSGMSRDINISQFIGNKNNMVDGVKFIFDPNDESDFDFIFVIDNVDIEKSTHNVREKGLFFFSAEHIYGEDYYIKNDNVKTFINQFSRVFSCYVTGHQNQNYEIPFLPWMINHNHGTYRSDHERDVNYFNDLKVLNKSKFLSVICSTKVFSPEQRVRLDFVSKLKSIFGDDLDWFGNGINPIIEKWQAISEYKYHIVLENRIGNNVISEKLFDSFLGMSLPLYSGAPNVTEYFSENSLIKIDAKNLDKTTELLKNLKSHDYYNEHIKHILLSKAKVLNEYNVWMRLANIAREYHKTLGEVKRQQVSKLKSRGFMQIITDFGKNYSIK